MFDCSDIAGEIADPEVDPRLDGDSLRCLPGSGTLGSILLVGVVHDHPASIYRVAHFLEAVTPATLALELPPLAMPLFRLYGRDRYTPPRLGGEMSMALQAANDVRTVGIDGPNREYLRLLVEALRDGVAPDVGRRVLKDLGSGFAHALACRLGAVVGSLTPLRLRVYAHIEYDCSVLDEPSAQADHEASHVAQRRAFLGAIETPPAMRLIDDVREASMASKLRELRRSGDIVAVVGIEHLDALESALS